MKKNKLVEAALLGSSSALGLNWIYDRELLLEESKNGKMIFRCIDHDLYKKAKKSYDVYPNHKVGQLDFMGEMLYLFHMFYDYDDDRSFDRWMLYFYEYFSNDQEYDGYIETYGKDLLKRYKQSLDNDEKPNRETDHVDKQLGGLVFLLHLYESPKSIDKINDALRYARTITSYVNITQLTVMLHELLKKLDYGINKKVGQMDVPEEKLECGEIINNESVWITCKNCSTLHDINDNAINELNK